MHTVFEQELSRRLPFTEKTIFVHVSQVVVDVTAALGLFSLSIHCFTFLHF